MLLTLGFQGAASLSVEYELPKSPFLGKPLGKEKRKKLVSRVQFPGGAS